MLRPVIFGESLFDVFPDGRRVLGGAPFNVAWHLQGFGAQPLLLSRVGTDPEGDEILSRMRAWGLSTDGTTVDRDRPTGRVTVTIAGGEPSFDIEADQAYDNITLAGINLPEPKQVGLIYHGTLSLRSRESRTALREMASSLGKPIFCDVNLRTPWWNAELLRGVLTRSSWVKLNRDELTHACGHSGDVNENARRLVDSYQLKGLIVTLGAEGAIALLDGASYSVQASSTPGQGDSVGAGDAFSAVIILGLLGRWHPDVMLRRAAGFAGKICTIPGATTDRPELYAECLQQWKSEGM